LVLLTAAGGRPSAPARASLEPHLAYGINVRNLSHLDPLVAPLGFEWIKLSEGYGPPPSERLPYHVLYLIECEGFTGDMGAWTEHVEELAVDGLGRVDAYEICNEPNLIQFWDNRMPDPALYAQMLCIAYERIKSIDPQATVISGGSAPVGRIQGTCDGWSGNNCGVMDERIYAQEVLAHGADACMDAFGYHPHGFAYEPERDPAAVENGFAFRGVEVMRQILLTHGLGEMPIWATEFGWIRDPSLDGRPECHEIAGYEFWFGWMDVSESQQADYLVRAFQYADENWPWMQGIFVWNLDWHNYNWSCEASRFFSIRRDDGSDLGAPTSAYWALAAMEKRPAPFTPRLSIRPEALLFLADVNDPGPVNSMAVVRNAGYRTLSWTATADPAGEIVPTLPISAGAQGDSLWVRVDTGGLVTGTYSGAVTVTATASDVLDSPMRLPLELRILPQIERCFLPTVIRSSTAP
jgi:hypothetical protein